MSYDDVEEILDDVEGRVAAVKLVEVELQNVKRATRSP